MFKLKVIYWQLDKNIRDFQFVISLNVNRLSVVNCEYYGSSNATLGNVITCFL